MGVNAQFASMHTALFNRLADPCTVTRGAAAPVDSRCIVEEGDERLGEYGQVIGRVRMVSFIKSEWDPARGDVVTIDGTAQTVEAIEEDDGLVVKVVLNA
jgi:hypothetical protein